MAKSWDNSNFGKRIDVTIPSPGGNLTDHPVPIILDGRGITDTDIVEGEWACYDATGTLIPWETEIYAEAASTCTGVVWTATDQYAAPADFQNHVYFYYDKVSGSVPGNTPGDVWDANFVGVWHLSESGDYPQDSSGTGNHMTAKGGTPVYSTAGEIGDAIDYDDASSEYHSAPDDATLDITGAATYSAWLKAATPSGTNKRLLGKGETSANYGLWFLLQNSGAFFFGSGAGWRQSSGTSYDDDAFHHIVGVYDNGGNVTDYHVYGDGSLDDGSTVGSRNVSANSEKFSIGCEFDDGTPENFSDGTIDELRVSNTDRSSDWIAQDFAVVDTGLTYAAIETKPAAGGRKHYIIGGGIGGL